MSIEKSRTKIICTLGPSTKDVLKEMQTEGMGAARINTAHGSVEEHREMIRHLREIGIPAILDVKGPEVRLRSASEWDVSPGDELVLGEDVHFSKDILDDVKDGARVLIDDGRLEAILERGQKIRLRFTKGGKLKDNKSVNVPGVRLNVDPLSEKDMRSLEMANEEQVAFVALSYTRDKEDVERVRTILDEGIAIIAKIESQEGVDKIEEIIDASDGIMVARGDLGVDLPFSKIPMIQKRMVRACREKGKLVIIATEMLESMIRESRPTRAEVSDVANAVLDGSDALMLSGETAIGKDPVGVVRTMAEIALEAQGGLVQGLPSSRSEDVSDAITASVFRLCSTFNVDKIVCITRTGHTARMMARFRADMPIIACTPSEMVARQVSLHYAILPAVMDVPDTGRIVHISQKLLSLGVIHRDDRVVFTAGEHTESVSNMLQVHTIRDLVD